MVVLVEVAMAVADLVADMGVADMEVKFIKKKITNKLAIKTPIFFKFNFRHFTYT